MEPILSAIAAWLAGLTGWSEPEAKLAFLAAIALVLLVLLVLVLRALFGHRRPNPALAAGAAASVDRLQELGSNFADSDAREAAVFIAKVSRNLLTKGTPSGAQRRGTGLLLDAYLPLALRAATALGQIEAGGRDGKQAIAVLKDIAIVFYDHLQGRTPPDPQPLEARIALAEVQAVKAWDTRTPPDSLAPRPET
jgi:hypothetical protein